MADGYWNWQPPFHPAATMPKRPRPDFDVPPGAPSGHEMLNFLPRDDRAGPHVTKDTKSIGASYDRYLQNAQLPSFGSGDASNFGGAGLGRGVGGAGMPGMPIGDPFVMGGHRSGGLDMAANGRSVGFGGQLSVEPITRPGPEMPLPPDASNTLFVEGLPPDSTKREVAHIFRPFLGFKEVRLVNKEAKHHRGDPLVLCFVDFTNAGCAATALSALQGYRMDEHEPNSPILRLQFARFPGPRSSGPGSRGRR